jgi:hypothetical protein
MHLVALTSLKAPSDATVSAIAATVGASEYDLRLLLNAGLPAVVLVADDGDRAARATAELRRLGHGAVICDRSQITPSSDMSAIRVIDFGPSELTPREGSNEALPYDDIACLLRATHVQTTESVEQVKERKLRPVMALATGGLVLSRTKSKEVRSSREERQQVLYLFRRSGYRPWILREREINYSGLGTKLAPSAMQNFQTAIAALRTCAPHAHYDETLLRSRPIRGVAPGIETIDVYAHILAAHSGA